MSEYLHIHPRMLASSHNLLYLLPKLSRTRQVRAQMKIQELDLKNRVSDLSRGHHKIKKTHGERIHKHKREGKRLQKSSRVDYRRPRSTSPRIPMKTRKNFIITGMAKGCAQSQTDFNTASIWLSRTPLFYFSKSSAFWLLPWLPTSRVTSPVVSEGQLTKSYKNRKVPGEICGSCPESAVLELQNSSRLTNLIVLRCNHRIVDDLWVWIDLPSTLLQQEFHTLGVRHALLQSFLIILGPGGFHHEKSAMKQQSRSLAERSRTKRVGDWWSNNQYEVCSQMSVLL